MTAPPFPGASIWYLSGKWGAVSVLCPPDDPVPFREWGSIAASLFYFLLYNVDGFKNIVCFQKEIRREKSI
jgi:hypothetical protein